MTNIVSCEYSGGKNSRADVTVHNKSKSFQNVFVPGIIFDLTHTIYDFNTLVVKRDFTTICRIHITNDLTCNTLHIAIRSAY